MSNSPFQIGGPLVDEGDPMAWKRQGACRERNSDGTLVHDPEVFFPLKRAEQHQRAGKKVCRHCPVIMECRAWAMTHEEVGIWGGTSEYERRRMKNKTRYEARRDLARQSGQRSRRAS